MAAGIMAIAGFFCCGLLLTVPAAIVGWLELDAIKNGRAPVEGKTMAQIGLWGGIAGTVIHAVLLVFYFVFAALGSVGGY
jgi:hypothetical protein